MPTTAHYSFYKPTNGENGWGSLVSANFDDIDSLLFAGDHGNLSSDGTFALHGTAQVALSTSPTAWNPTGLSTSSLIYVTLDAARTVHGIVPGAGDVDGLVKMFWNVSAFDWTLAADSGSASAANRILLPDGDVVLGNGEGIMLAYDDTVHRWRPIGGVSSSGGGGGGAPTDAAYLIGATSGVTGLSSEILVGTGHFGGELDVVGSTFADPEIISVHGPEALPHHDETHPFDDDAIHTNWTAEVPSPVGLTAAAGATGANYGDHVHRGATDIVSLDAIEGPNASSDTDQTVLSYTLGAGKAVAKMRFHFQFAGFFTNTSGSSRNIQMKVKVGGTTLLTITLAIVSGNTDAPFCGDADLIFRTIGATAKLIASGRANGSDGGGTNWSPVSRAAVGTETTKDSTASLAILLTSANSFNGATVSHSIELASMSLEGVAA